LGVVVHALLSGGGETNAAEMGSMLEFPAIRARA
jgi:hypothetical protein